MGVIVPESIDVSGADQVKVRVCHSEPESSVLKYCDASNSRSALVLLSHLPPAFSATAELGTCAEVNSEPKQAKSAFLVLAHAKHMTYPLHCCCAVCDTAGSRWLWAVKHARTSTNPAIFFMLLPA